MNQEYFCPVCGYVIDDDGLEMLHMGKNVDSVEQNCKGQESLMNLFGRDRKISMSGGDC
ncbi:MAG: hypothetical protein ACLSF7_14305 [Acutalibacteraceae bacterium]